MYLQRLYRTLGMIFTYSTTVKRMKRLRTILSRHAFNTVVYNSITFKYVSKETSNIPNPVNRNCF